MVLMAARLRSIKREKAAPAERFDANTAGAAKQVQPAGVDISVPMMLKSASFTISVIGRVISPGTDCSRMPRAVPAIMRGLLKAVVVSRPVGRLDIAIRRGGGQHAAGAQDKALSAGCWMASSALLRAPARGVPSTIVSHWRRPPQTRLKSAAALCQIWLCFAVVPVDDGCRVSVRLEHDACRAGAAGSATGHWRLPSLADRRGGKGFKLLPGEQPVLACWTA
jgi:hypothetical protein